MFRCGWAIGNRPGAACKGVLRPTMNAIVALGPLPPGFRPLCHNFRPYLSFHTAYQGDATGARVGRRHTIEFEASARVAVHPGRSGR